MVSSLGRFGVDAHVKHEGDPYAVVLIAFLVNEGTLVTATADDSLHLWNFRQKTPQVVQRLQFQRERITCIHLPIGTKWLYVGTEKGNIYVVNIDTFSLSGYVINWNKAIDPTMKDRPGAVVHLSDNPLDANKLLVGFECGQLVLWDMRGKIAELRWQSAEPLRSVSWHHEGKHFVTSHTDGSLCTWPLRLALKPQLHIFPHAKTNKDGKLESCKPIHKVEIQTNRMGESIQIFSGGLSMEKGGKSPCITVMQGKSTTVLEMEHSVIDFITICESPWASDMQEPYAIAVLLQNDLVLIDLLTPGFPTFESPYSMDLHESPVTCCSYFADCPSDLVPAFYSVGRNPTSRNRTGLSEREWPLSGGEWSPTSCSYSEIILTGHQDGSVKFWDSGAGTLQFLYKLKTGKIFEKPRTRSMDGSDEDPLAIQLISLCAESRRLCLAGNSGHVILFKFRRTESSSDTLVLEIPITYENFDDGETSPECEFIPRSLPKQPESTDSEKKNDGMLRLRPGPQRKPPGFQAQLVCLTPWTNGTFPGQITSLCINSSYGLMAYGNEYGLVLVDILQKVCLLNVASPDLYGAQDPYSRTPRSPKRLDVSQYNRDEQARSPSIDQPEIIMKSATASTSASLPPSSLPADAFASNRSRPPSPALECFEDLTPEELAKMEEAQSKGRKQSAWKSFSFKKQLSRAEMRIKNTFKEGGAGASSGNPGQKSSTFYYASDGAPLSPVETSPNSESNSTPTSPDIEQKEFAGRSETDSGGTVTPTPPLQQSTAVTAVAAAFELVTKNLDELGNRTEVVDSGGDDTKSRGSEDDTDSSPTTETEEKVPAPVTPPPTPAATLAGPSKKVDFVEDVMVKSVHTSVEGAMASRPSDLPLEDVPVRPPRTKKFIDKRTERLLSVPNLKLTKMESHKLKDLRSKSTKHDPSSFTGNLMRRFNKLDNSFSRSRSSSMSSLENITSEAVTCLAFADSYTKKSDPSAILPTLWLGTSLGTVLTVSIVLPDSEARKIQPVIVSILGGPMFRLKGSILSMSFLDCNGALIPYSFEAWKDENRDTTKERRDRTPTKSTANRMSPTLCGQDSFSDRQFIVIVSEKQARVVALPSQNCVYRQQITDTDCIVKAEIISMKDSVCLVCYVSTGHLLAYSLPSLRPLLDVDFLPLADLSFQTKCKQGIVDPMLSIWGQQLIVHEDTNQIAKTFSFSNKGHGLYLASPTEIQKFTICAEFCQLLNEMMGELYKELEMPEQPKESFFKGLFGGGARSLDREELFGESSGKASRSVAKILSGPNANLEQLGARANTASSEVGRAHQLMLERGDKLGQLEERTERMASEALNFQSSAHSLMNKYKDKKWYQL